MSTSIAVNLNVTRKFLRPSIENTIISGRNRLNLKIIEEKMLNEAKKLTYEIDDHEILIEIQHYGGRTNLIDFTTDHLIALFFACDGAPDKDGRVIRQKTETIKDLIKHPRNPRHRIKAQKTVFVIPPNGFVEPGQRRYSHYSSTP